MKYSLKITLLIAFAAISFSCAGFSASAETQNKNETNKATGKAVKSSNGKKVVTKDKKAVVSGSKKIAHQKGNESVNADETKVEEVNNKKFVRNFDKWDLFKIDQDSRKVCFITSVPESEKGNYKKRSEPYVLVTYRGRGTPEVSISSGYGYKANSFLEVHVDDKKYDFFTSDKTPKVAWAKDAKTDAEIINVMKKGTKLVAKGVSQADTHSEDTYSLKGFKAAFESIINYCK